MFDRLKEMKDNALGLALQSFLSERISDFGELLDCEIDTRRGRVVLKALLKGESQPIEVCIERYRLEKRDGDRFITVDTISSSREWIARLLTRLYVRKPYKVPAPVAALL